MICGEVPGVKTQPLAKLSVEGKLYVFIAKHSGLHVGRFDHGRHCGGHDGEEKTPGKPRTLAQVGQRTCYLSLGLSPAL